MFLSQILEKSWFLKNADTGQVCMFVPSKKGALIMSDSSWYVKAQVNVWAIHKYSCVWGIVFITPLLMNHSLKRCWQEVVLMIKWESDEDQMRIKEDHMRIKEDQMRIKRGSNKDHIRIKWGSKGDKMRIT